MDKDIMILGNGEQAVFTTDSQQTGLNNNVIVCASSGAGKTMSIIEPRLLETYNSSLVVTVAKRKLVHKYTKMFEDRGYIVYDMNFAAPQKSNISYDPLPFLRSNIDISNFAESLVATQSSSGIQTYDPYWDRSSVSLLSALIAYVKRKMMNQALQMFSFFLTD